MEKLDATLEAVEVRSAQEFECQLMILESLVLH